MRNNRRVVILGSRGMAGHMISWYLSGVNKYEVTGLARTSDSQFVDRQADAENLGQLAHVLKAIQPEVVVNCVGVLNARADDDPGRAIFLNSYLPHWLAQLGNGLGFRLIHLSTDCVFLGASGGYTEASVTDGTTLYARTKALGEVSSLPHLTFRTSIVGPELKRDGSGLLEWFLRQTGPVSGYSSVLWTGVTTLELAKAIHAAIDQNLIGLYHLVPSRPISKYDLLCEMARAFHMTGVQIKPQGTPRSQRTLLCTRTDFDFEVHGYGVMLNELAETVHDMPDLRWK